MKIFVHLWRVAEFFVGWIGNVSDKSCKENQKTNFVFSNLLPTFMLFMR